LRPANPARLFPALALVLLVPLAISACRTSSGKEPGVNLRSADPGYFQQLERRINRGWGPAREGTGSGTQARRLAEQYAQSGGGIVVVSFSIRSDGRLDGDPAVEESSGSSFLDEEAVRAVRAAAPFPPIPRSLHTDRIDLIWRFEHQAGLWEGE
jgi:TonB family protein